MYKLRRSINSTDRTSPSSRITPPLACVLEAGAYFLVVGSGRQERDAWGWRREMQMGGLPVRRLLAGGRWRELVPRTDSG